MNKRNGFTLIELLTVIAILAVILLITVPTILGVLEKSKKNTFRDQALLYVDGLKKNALVDTFETNPNMKLPDNGKSLSINVEDIPMDMEADVKGNIVVTNNEGSYTYVLYITNGEYIICNKEHNKVTTKDIEKGSTCGDSLLYPTITNKFESQTYNYGYNITKELILNGVTASDATDGNITDRITYTGSVDTSKVGTYEIVYRVENSLGNYVTAKRKIIVKDTESPVITNSILKETIDKGTSYNNYLSGITVQDNYDSNITATYICRNGILEKISCNTIGSKAGVYYIIYDAMDSSNNKYSESGNVEVKREILVKDVNAPEIVLKGESTIRMEVKNTFTDPGYSAIDDEDGDITSKVETSSNLNINKPGTYTIEYIVVDSAGNRGIVTRTVVVSDTTKPSITKISGNPTSWVQEATITLTASDNYQLHSEAYSFDDGATWQSGNSKKFTSNGTIKIKVRDTSGNISDVNEVNITKIDTTTPTINLNSVPTTITVGSSYALPTGYTANGTSKGSAVCKDGSTTVTNTNSLSVGSHTIKCTVTTGAGKTASVSKTITVNNKAYTIGQQVTLKDNTIWYVIENSPGSSNTVTLFASQNINKSGTGWTTTRGEYGIVFDASNERTTEKNSYCTNPANGCNIYASQSGIVTNGSHSGTVTEDSTIKKFVDSKALPYINNSLKANGGINVNSIRIITVPEICNIINAQNSSNKCSISSIYDDELSSMKSDYVNVPTWLYSTYYWTMTPDSSIAEQGYTVSSSGSISYDTVMAYNDQIGARPVIVTNKSNIK